MEDAEAAIREENRAYRRTAKRELRELERLASESPTEQNLHALSVHRAMTSVFYDIYGAGEADEKESTEDTYDENDNEHRVAEEEEKGREKVNWIRANIALGGHRTTNGGLDVGEAKELESTKDTYDENDNKPGIAAEEVLRREYDAQEDPRKLRGPQEARGTLKRTPGLSGPLRRGPHHEPSPGRRDHTHTHTHHEPPTHTHTHTHTDTHSHTSQE